jgi:hypothetical protein
MVPLNLIAACGMNAARNAVQSPLRRASLNNRKHSSTRSAASAILGAKHGSARRHDGPFGKMGFEFLVWP